MTRQKTDRLQNKTIEELQHIVDNLKAEIETRVIKQTDIEVQIGISISKLKT